MMSEAREKAEEAWQVYTAQFYLADKLHAVSTERFHAHRKAEEKAHKVRERVVTLAASYDEAVTRWAMEDRVLSNLRWAAVEAEMLARAEEAK